MTDAPLPFIEASAFRLTRAGMDYVDATFLPPPEGPPELLLTAVELGTGVAPTDLDAAGLTSPALTVPLQSAERDPDEPGQRLIHFRVSNEGVAAPIRVTEIGLWARIDGTPRLIAVAAPDPLIGPGYVPAQSGDRVHYQHLVLGVILGPHAPDVTINFNDDPLLASLDMVLELGTRLAIQRARDATATARALFDLAEAYRQTHPTYPEA